MNADQPTETTAPQAQQPHESGEGAGFSAVPGSVNCLTAAESRGYAEDRDLENGNYLNRCRACGEHFIGHKHRVFCKPCNWGFPHKHLPEMVGHHHPEPQGPSSNEGRGIQPEMQADPAGAEHMAALSSNPRTPDLSQNTGPEERRNGASPSAASPESRCG